MIAWPMWQVSYPEGSALGSGTEAVALLLGDGDFDTRCQADFIRRYEHLTKKAPPGKVGGLLSCWPLR
jgi:hypothetical protein